MDLDDFKTSDKPMPMTLTHPTTGLELTKDGKPLTISILGPDTKVMQDHERAVQNRRLKIAQNTGRITLDAATIEAEMNARLVKSIAGWDNLTKGGKTLDFTPQAALELIQEQHWIRDQIDAFYQNRGNFFAPTGSLKN